MKNTASQRTAKKQKYRKTRNTPVSTCLYSLQAKRQETRRRKIFQRLEATDIVLALLSLLRMMFDWSNERLFFIANIMLVTRDRRFTVNELKAMIFCRDAVRRRDSLCKKQTNRKHRCQNRLTKSLHDYRYY